MKLSKKTILIISGISVGVIVLSLGVGLGVGLSSSSSSSTQPIVTETIYRIASNAFSQEDLERGNIEVEGVSYNVVKEDNKFYLKVPAQNDLSFSAPTVKVPRMFNDPEVVYDETTNDEWGKGKDDFYKIDSIPIGVVKIQNNTIYGGFEEVKDNQDIVTGYQLHSLLDSDTYPNGYPIGSFDANGGGINLLKVQQLNAILDDNPTTTKDNVPTTTEFGFFVYNIPRNQGEGNLNSKATIVLGTNKISSNPVDSIGYKPSQSFGYVHTSFPYNTFIDDTQVKYFESDGVTIKQRTDEIVSKVKFFKKRDGSDYIVTLGTTNDLDSVVKTINLNELYIPITYEPGKYVDNILGSLQLSLDNKLRLPDSFILDPNVSREISVTNNQFSLPKIKLELKLSTFDEEKYATESTMRSPNELLINVSSDLHNYFREIANYDRVKNLAKKYGITIRFKINPFPYEQQLVKSKGSFSNDVAQVFFPSIEELDSFNQNNIVAPLRYVLKDNLNNNNYYDDFWRKIGVLKDSPNEYGLYPFYIKSPIIAYNKDYLPNGFDLKNKDLGDYLYKSDLGSLDDVSKFKEEQDINDNAKESLIFTGRTDRLVGASLIIWASKFYQSLKKDQDELQQNLLWKVKDSENSFYSVLKDPNLKNNKNFQSLFETYHIYKKKNSTSDRYGIYALLNGHIGGFLLTDLQYMRGFLNWEHRNTGTDQEKKDFINKKIMFQTLPPRMGSSKGSRLSVMISSLRNDKWKQELAEVFIDALTTSSNVINFSLNFDEAVLPRKDFNVANSNNRALARINKAAAISSPLLPFNYPNWFIGNFNQALDFSNNIEDAINTFLTSTQNYNILAPVDP